MKNTMADVRDHLVAMLETLGDEDCDATAIERARATALVADKFIAAVKVEVDARKLLDAQNLPPALQAPAVLPPLRAIAGDQR
jgi:hypothetical protein